MSKMTNDDRQTLSILALVGPTVICACLMPIDRMFSDGWIIGLPVLGCWLMAQVHKAVGETVEDEKARLARTPELRPQHPREKMMAFFRSCPGGRPTLKQARDYIASHQWWKPPYCRHREVGHCSRCPDRQLVTSYRHGDLIIKTEIVKDCRGRDPIEIPTGSPCMTCRHCRPHSNDEFHDCEIPLRTADSDRPNGMDYYLPFFYPKKDGCPYHRPSYTKARMERSWRNRHDGELLIRVLHSPEKEAEAALDEFIRVSTPGSPESKKSYVPDWFLKEQAEFIAKSEAEEEAGGGTTRRLSCGGCMA